MEWITPTLKESLGAGVGGENGRESVGGCALDSLILVGGVMLAVRSIDALLGLGGATGNGGGDKIPRSLSGVGKSWNFQEIKEIR